MSHFNLKKSFKLGLVGLSSLALIGSSGAGALAQGGHDGAERHRSERTAQQQNTQGDNQDQSQRQNRRGDGNHNDEQRRGWWQWWRKPKPQPARTCEERQADVNQQITDFKSNAATYQSRLDTFYTYQQNYIAETGIVVENYEGLQNNINQAQTSAQAAVEAVSAPTLDCNQPEANDKQAVRQAKQAAKDSLNHYRAQVLQLAWMTWREVGF